MANRDNAAENTPSPALAPNVPPAQVVDDNPKAGPGQVAVTSPTGARSIVDEAAVESLKTQGYKVG